MDSASHLHQEQRQRHGQCAVYPDKVIKLPWNDGIRELIVRTEAEELCDTYCKYAAQDLTADEMARLGQRGLDGPEAEHCRSAV